MDLRLNQKLPVARNETGAASLPVTVCRVSKVGKPGAGMHEAFAATHIFLQTTVTLSAILRRRTDDLELLNTDLSACGPSQH